MRNSDAKEQLISDVQTSMQPFLSSQQLDILMHEISKSLNSMKVEYDSKLPSTDILNNGKFVKAFLVSKKIEGLSEHTLKSYCYTITKVLDAINIPVQDITSNHIRCWLLDYGKRASNVTVENARKNLNSFFTWLETEGYIDKNPINRIKRIKCEKKIKTPLTTVEVEKIRDACQNIRETALIDLLVSTGIRCEEITKIEMSDISFETSSIKIHGKGAKERIVYMSDKCKLHLMQYLAQRGYESVWLFTNKAHRQLTTEGVSFIMRELGERAGVPKCQVHRFRKYFATTLFSRGCDIVYIKQLLGHAKIDTTLIYVQTVDSRVKSNFQQYV